MSVNKRISDFSSPWHLSEVKDRNVLPGYRRLRGLLTRNMNCIVSDFVALPEEYNDEWDLAWQRFQDDPRKAQTMKETLELIELLDRYIDKEEWPCF